MRDPATVSVGRVVKCGVSACVYAATRVSDVFTRLSGRTPPGRCVIVYYHSVPREQRAKFAQQMKILIRYAKAISLDGDVFVPAGERRVAVTIDDAFENLLVNAVPALQRLKIPATIFAISGAMGKNFGDAGAAERVMTAEQLRGLPADLITVGSHTVSHPFLPSLNQEAARRELEDSRAELSKLLQRDIRLFSFPFGGCTSQLIKACRKAGYHRVFTTLPRFAFASTREFAVGRVRVDPTDWNIEFSLKIAGAYRWLPWAFAMKRRMLASSWAKLLMPRKNRGASLRIPKAAIQ
jgi:peptidoglycan/xylan/chitin deacetylase (PgdA/CDA1 family)